MTDPFVRLSSVMVRRRWVVVAAWVILLLVGGIVGQRANAIVKPGGFETPGSESTRAADILDRDFNASIRDNLVVVFRSSNRTVADAAYRQAVTAAANRLRRARGIRAVRTYFDSGDPSLVSPDRHVTLAIVTVAGDQTQTEKTVPLLRQKLQGISVAHYVTGGAAVERDASGQSEVDLRRSEMVTIPVVLILLLLVFRTAIAAAVPLILGACSIAIATGLIAAIGSVVDTSTFALNVASMIGLGLAIDFSLVVVSRFRQELAAGHGAADAVAVTQSTAGHSIAYSGITVTLSMLVMTALMHNLMIVRSMSMAVALVVLTGLAAALTLLPALLALLGVRIELFRVLPRRERRPDETGAWYRISGAIMARPWLWLGLSLALLAAIALPVRDMRLGLGTADSPTQTQAYKGFEVLTAAFGPSRAAPIQVVLHAGRGGVFAPDFLIGLKRLTRSFPVSSSSGPTRRWWAGKRCDSWTLGTRSTAAFRCWSPWWWS